MKMGEGKPRGSYKKQPIPPHKTTKAELTYDLVEAVGAFIDDSTIHKGSQTYWDHITRIIESYDRWWENPIDYPKNRKSNRGGKVKRQ